MVVLLAAVMADKMVAAMAVMMVEWMAAMLELIQVVLMGLSLVFPMADKKASKLETD
jgi:hypothetical protein